MGSQTFTLKVPTLVTASRDEYFVDLFINNSFVGSWS